MYSLADRQKILSVCEELKPTVYTKAIELMFCLDIRIGELRALYKADVDLEHKTVYVGHQMVDVKTDKDICEKVGIKYLSSHGIRFHNISALYDAGVSEKEIQRLSGHSTAKMTQYYNRRISDPAEDAKIRAVLD